MRKIYTFLFAVCISAFGPLFGQDPAGTCMYNDINQFNTDQLRRYFNCGNDASLNPGGSMTLEAWARPEDSGWNMKLVGKLNPSFNSGYVLAVDQGKCYPEVWNPSHSDLLSGFIPPTKHWVHFAFTFTQGGELIAYVNGDSVGATLGNACESWEPRIHV